MIQYEWRPGHPSANDDVYCSTQIDIQNSTFILSQSILQFIQSNDNTNNDNV